MTSLSADCARCFALCCVAPAFAASADFAIDKEAGRPCPNLRPDFRCGIHHDLRGRGFPGCTVYDCFGAGQKVAQVTFGGRDWRSAPETAGRMYEVFAVMRQLHELLWHLAEAVALPAAAPVRVDLTRAYDQVERLTRGAPDEVARVNVAARREAVNPLLVRASELARAGARVGRRSPTRAGRRFPARDRDRRDPVLRGADLGGAVLRGADLGGAVLREADLTGASLRGARLIGADLRRARLALADLTGADLRGARLGGADLAEALFLTQAQVDAAIGDGHTRLPTGRSRPGHWPARDD